MLYFLSSLGAIGVEPSSEQGLSNSSAVLTPLIRLQVGILDASIRHPGAQQTKKPKLKFKLKKNPRARSWLKFDAASG
jgi:hypothetical protein